MFIFRMDAIARQVCLNAGGDAFTQGEDVEAILDTLRNYFQPDALGHVYYQATKFSREGRAGQTAERYLLEFDVLRER